jgi:hypothetical protein
MLQYYTLEEAAKLLGLHPDGAKKVLDDSKVRQYRDGRGKVRYVASAVDELARTLGRGSDPELPLGEAPRPKTGTTPRPTQARPGEMGSTAPFDVGPEDSAEVPIGLEKLGESGGSKSGSGRPAGSKSPVPRSPAPKSGSDSDVRLVSDSSELEFQIAADSDVKMVDEASSASRSGISKSGAPKSGPRKGPGESHDSDVRIVPMEVKSDSDVRIADEAEGSVELGKPPAKKHSDSDIRLEEAGTPPPRPADEGSDDAHVTEEIDLDAEERKHAEAAKAKGKSKMKRAESKPAGSPFELSDDSVELPKGGKKKPDSSSDFELTPAAADSDDSVELSSGEIAAMAGSDSSDEEVALGEVSGASETSGINLDAPADSGISLEGGEGSGDDMEFELSLDSGSTPKPAPKSGKKKKAKAAQEEDSSSEFELSLDADSSAEQPKSQKAAKTPEEDSDSEFELTLDDSGGLVPLEGEKAAAKGEGEGEGDIFETDFEVPALDEESGSEAVALDESDTDLESSDFDLALEEGDATGDEESGSQVVALEDEEEVDAAAETVQRPKKKKPAKKQAAAAAVGGAALEELADVDDEAAVSEEEEVEPAPQRGRAAPAAAVAAAPAQWGAMPAIVLLPCVVVMLLAGFMGFELVRSMVGYQQPGKVSGFLAEGLAKTFNLDLPKD